MKKIRLKDIDTTAPKHLNKNKAKKELEKMKVRIEELQNLLYAEGKQSVLIILQGMDASGKDGVVKNVFDRVNPMGCEVIPFKAPTELETKHDFLWRIHQNTPAKGMMHIFNRSQYEDVLIQRVHNWIDKNTVKSRFDHINNFEKLLTENRTRILKFYLHISKEEQLVRLNERMNDKTKMWKYNDDDLKEREFWDEYMKAYEDVFDHCSSAAPWTIVPSDQNWYKEYVIGKKVIETLEAMNMKFPGFKKS